MALKTAFAVLVLAAGVLIACARDGSVSDILMKRLEDYDRDKIRSNLEEALEKIEEQMKESQPFEDTESRIAESPKPIADGAVQEIPPLSDLPFLPQKKCCVPGFTHVNLKNDAGCDVINTAAGVEVIAKPSLPQGEKRDCSKTALLKITFDKLTEKPCDFCLEAPYCGRRMLKIDLQLSAGVRSGWGFNLGDSSTNDGYGGDSNTQINDAEAQGTFPNVVVYKSDRCNSGVLQTFTDAMGTAVNQVTLYVSNQHIRVTNDQGFDEKICSECLYALNGQADSQGINQDIYLGLNRVVTGRADRNGVGVCSATLTWLCPRW